MSGQSNEGAQSSAALRVPYNMNVMMRDDLPLFTDGEEIV
jgi:hypothetical protein